MILRGKCSMKAITEEHKLDVVNPDTGELEKKTFERRIYHTNLKGGYTRMYPKKYDAALELIIHSNLDIRIWNTIRGKFTKNRVETNLPSAEIAKGLGTSQQNIMKFIKKMRDEDVLMKVSHGIYRLNPFVYVPFMSKGEVLQKEWLELVDKKEEK